MFDSTRRSLGDGLRIKFRRIACRVHGDAPKFTVTGIYDRESEEMDIAYHVDTCCNEFLLDVMKRLNQRA